MSAVIRVLLVGNVSGPVTTSVNGFFFLNGLDDHVDFIGPPQLALWWFTFLLLSSHWFCYLIWI